MKVPGAKEDPSLCPYFNGFFEIHWSLFLVRLMSVLSVYSAGTGSLICWNWMGREKEIGDSGWQGVSKVYASYTGVRQGISVMLYTPV